MNNALLYILTILLVSLSTFTTYSVIFGNGKPDSGTYSRYLADFTLCEYALVMLTAVVGRPFAYVLFIVIAVHGIFLIGARFSGKWYTLNFDPMPMASSITTDYAGLAVITILVGQPMNFVLFGVLGVQLISAVFQLSDADWGSESVGPKIVIGAISGLQFLLSGGVLAFSILASK